VIRWLVPSVVAACVGALAASAIELSGFGSTGGALGAIATIGFLALLAVPVLAVTSVVARALLAAWQPRRLADRLVEDTGGAPVLAAWALIAWLAAAALAAVLFQGIWVLANNTAWKAPTVSLAVPLIGAVTLVLMLALLWPVARILTWLLRRLDDVRLRAGRRSLLRPRWIALALVVMSIAFVTVSWYLLIKPHLGPFDTSMLVTPGVAAIATVLAHAGWRIAGPRVRMVAGGAVCAVTLAATVCALVVAHTSPNVTLAIWGDRAFAGLAVDELYDPDALRDSMSAAELAPTVARPGAAHPDIVLITIDTLRADHTPPYGGTADMPALRHLGEIGSIFNWAFSPSNVTRRSIPSMSLGLDANRVHGREAGGALHLDPRHVGLAERLQAGGYETAGFMCCDSFWGPQAHTGWQRGLAHLEIEQNGAELAKKAREWIDAREATHATKPLFVWMHVIEPHDWMIAPGEGRNDIEKRRFYDRSLATADQALVTVLGAFSNRAPEKAPIVIVTSDHGEGLGEHGAVFHASDLYDTQTRVPLVIAGPGIFPGHVPETVSLVGLMPTILELAGFEPPRVDGTGLPRPGSAAEGQRGLIDGKSFADLATGKRPADPEAGTAFLAQIRDRSNPAGITAIVQGRWKLISSNGALELYDVHGDPGERYNVVHAPARVKQVGELRALLDERERAGSQSPFR
jgi:hypothetical protein